MRLPQPSLYRIQYTFIFLLIALCVAFVIELTIFHFLFFPASSLSQAAYYSMAVVEVHTHKMLTHFRGILTKFHFLEYFHPNFYQSFHFVQTDGDDIPGIGQYEDFHTIDWQRDIARDRMRHRYIVKKVQDSIWDFLKVSIVSQLERIYVNIEIDIFLVIFFFCHRVHMMRGRDGCACY